MKLNWSAATISVLLSLAFTASAAAQSSYWVRPMQEVHQDFTGLPGTIARFGDSITNSLAFFAPLEFSHQNTSAADAEALTWIQQYLPTDVWNWQISASNGAAGGTTSSWPLEPTAVPGDRNIDQWLANLNPEMAVIMWGTNELHSATPVAEYKARMREITQTVKDNGTIPILTTVPPRHGFTSEAALFADAVRELALEQQVPLIDYHAEIFSRNPGDSWDGVLVYISGSVYEVERLIAGDGVHPSNPSAYRRDFSADALDKNGFNLRNYLTLNATYEVYNDVIIAPFVAIPEPATHVLGLLAIVGLVASARRRRPTAACGVL
ncbi:MAG: GDSL-type esterase/lipase family protein [Pirellulales bacterium]